MAFCLLKKREKQDKAPEQRVLSMQKEEARGRRGKIGLCAFCRVPASCSSKEEIKRMKKLMEANNAYAFYNFAGYYACGDQVVQRDYFVKTIMSYC